ncbi:hypothetical protein CSA57_14520 [candidate division KSB3 bacterium]|nr:MAG: hypothetical protein CSA57_14520 [candidate division KSB3 bacterium]
MENMKATTMDKLQKRQATASSHLDQLEQDISQLRAQIEESYYLNQRLREQNKELQAAISNVAEQESAKREEAFQALLAEQQAKDVKIQQMLKKQQENVNAIQKARVRELERKAKEAKLAAQLAQQRKNAVKKGGSTEHDDSKAIYATHKKVKRTQTHKSVSQPLKEETTQPTAAPQHPIKTVKRVTPTAATVKTEPKAPSAPVAVQPKPSTAPSGNQTDNQMAKGKSLLKQKRYQQALDIFEDIALNKTAKDRVAARFMMGECQFALKQYDLAVVNYQNVVARNPDNAIAPQALIRQAEAFEKMADKETAKLVYSKVIKNYGGSPQAAAAKEQLKKL